MTNGATTSYRQDPVEEERVSAAATARHALERPGGGVGIAVAAAPTVAFVVADALGGLTWALIALAVSAPVVFGVRLVRREPLRAALIGLLIAAVCALVAALSGEARGFFLVPTLLPTGWALVLLGSVLVGRPLTGLAFNRLVGGPPDWRRHASLRRVYALTTLAAAGICLVNFVLGAVFYATEQLAAMAALHLAVVPVPFAMAAVTIAAARRAVRAHRSHTR